MKLAMKVHEQLMLLCTSRAWESGAVYLSETPVVHLKAYINSSQKLGRYNLSAFSRQGSHSRGLAEALLEDLKLA